jgi:hypothetical protein
MDLTSSIHHHNDRHHHDNNITSSSSSHNVNVPFDPAPDCSKAWIDAISKAGRMASNPRSEDLEAIIAYLDSLRRIVEEEEDMWDRPPTEPPPPMTIDDGRNDMTMNMNHTTTTILPHPMEWRRLMIRILTSLSELQAARASRYGKQREWSAGADAYSVSYVCVNRALTIADEQYAKLLTLEELHNTTTTTSQRQRNPESSRQDDEDDADDAPTSTSPIPMTVMERRRQTQALIHDSNVVHVAIAHFATDRDHYTTMAERRARYLRNKLEPQWTSRDDVKGRMGADKWRNNPNPKNDYSALRDENEQELQELESALVALSELDATTIEWRVQNIVSVMSGNGTLADNHHHHAAAAATAAATTVADGMRYNGIRPNDNDNQSSRSRSRVSWDDYPDPTDFDWIFTGSSEASCVEFFEMTTDDGALVKLDFYYTTGTVKTSMVHPTRGPTQLYGRGSSVSPQLYRDILADPRVHTNVRYQTTRHPNNGPRSSGRGFGRGRGRSNDNRQQQPHYSSGPH